MSGINYISVTGAVENKARESDLKNNDIKYITLPFYKNGKPLSAGKKWGITLLAANSMRFRWNEVNPVRDNLFTQILTDIKSGVCTGSCSSSKGECDCKYSFVPLELIHSKKVYTLKSKNDTLNLQGDGMITDCKTLIPVVTVSDCVPIFLYDCQKEVFGVVHSGWKGTGIIGEAIKKAVDEFGSRVQDICIAIGPHICEKCYCVDEERHNYFEENFGPCTAEINGEKILKTSDGKLLNYSLSLTKANIEVIKSLNIPEENIVAALDCTSCSVFPDGSSVFGSYRRQAAFLPPEVDADTRSRSMCVQAAFVV